MSATENTVRVLCGSYLSKSLTTISTRQDSYITNSEGGALAGADPLCTYLDRYTGGPPAEPELGLCVTVLGAGLKILLPPLAPDPEEKRCTGPKKHREAGGSRTQVSARL